MTKTPKPSARILHLDIEGYTVRRNGTVIGRRGQPLRPRLNDSGYPVVRLPSGWVPVHRLVALVYVPNPEGLETVNHKDGNKEHNHARNLEWVSRKDNLYHAMDTGLHNWGRRRIEAVKDNKVTAFVSQAEAARVLGVAQPNINKCLKGNRPQAGGYVWRYAA